MRPVRGAKGIVHVKIAQLGKRLGELRIVGLLTGLEPNILEQRDIAVLHVVDDFFRHVADGVVTENDGMMDQGMQIFADWPKRIFFHRLSLRPAKMGHQNSFRAMFAEIIDGGQAFADPGVIGHANFTAANLGRHVKSTRTSPRFPPTSRSRTESFAIIYSYSWSCSRSVSQHFHQLHAAIAVAPFIIVPADHFYEAITRH